MAALEVETLREQEVSRTGATYLSDVAETIRDDALRQAQSGLGNLAKRLDQKALFKRADFVERFAYWLAKAAALSIAANDQRVEQVFLFEAEPNPDVGSEAVAFADASVHLLAVVSPPSAALEAFIASLDRSLAQSLRELDIELFNRRESILDVKLITQEDIANNTGYAVLLRSIHAPALRIWLRGED